MPTSRRSFLQLIGAQGLVAASSSPRLAQNATRNLMPKANRLDPNLLHLDSNENSHGPGSKVLAAIQDAFGRVNRYPFQIQMRIREALAPTLGVSVDQIALGVGSTEILDSAVRAFTTPNRALLTSLPTFELPATRARDLGSPVAEVPVTNALSLDLEQIAAKAAGAGLIYVCNPNNPTATLHGSRAIEDFVNAALAQEPNATILIDEAYYEFVDRADYKTAIPLAVSNPRVIVSRTFSKIYGLAGLRIGYAVGQPETLEAIGHFLGPISLTHLSGVAALAALQDPARVVEQRRLNQEARAFTAGVFHDAGYTPVESQANFLMVDVKRDIRTFQAACRERGVEIARPFPPLLSHARVTIGTKEEMARAATAFKEALALPVKTVREESLPPLASWRPGFSC
jgi:histidinol-phosphate aminotransferase